MGMGMITECLQEVGKEPVEIERLNSKDNGVAIDKVVALRRKEVILSGPGEVIVGREVISC